MSYYLQIDLDDMRQVASNHGYGDLIRWVQKLPQDEAPNLRHLVRYGWSGEIGKIASELSIAIKNHAPPGDVLSTAKGLLTLIDGREHAEVVSITDGVGPSDGPE